MQDNDLRTPIGQPGSEDTTPEEAMSKKNSFAMRRKADLEKVVRKHCNRIAKIIKKTPPRRVYMKTTIYWENGKLSEFDSLDEPEYILHDVLVGKGMDNDLLEYGKACKESAAIMNPGSKPVAVTISTEAMLADSIKEEAEGMRVIGMPILIVAGRTINGIQMIELFPMLTDDYSSRFLVPEMAPPEEIIKRLEDAKEQAVDFMEPFFRGLEEGGPVERNISRL